MTKLTNTDCPACGVEFALPKVLYDTAYEHGKSFYCPNGHYIGWSKGSLEEKLEEERRARQRAEQRNAMLQDEVVELTRQSKRVANGVCPHCKRTFANLQRHMKTKHSQCAHSSS